MAYKRAKLLVPISANSNQYSGLAEKDFNTVIIYDSETNTYNFLDNDTGISQTIKFDRDKQGRLNSGEFNFPLQNIKINYNITYQKNGSFVITTNRG